MTHATAFLKRAPRRTLQALCLYVLTSITLMSTFSSDGAMRPSGFSDFFGWDDPVLALERQAAADEAIRADITSCMTSLGLKYDFPAPVEPSRAPGLSPQEYAAKYGFGILNGPPPEEGIALDPVAEYIDQLPADERARYIDALVQEPMWGQYGGGCVGKANAEVHGPRDAAFARLDAFAASINELVAQDPRALAADGAWAMCMEKAGFAIRSRTDLEEVIQDQIVGPSARLQASDAAARAALGALERRMAVAVFACDGPAQAEIAAVRATYEAAFIAEHRAELEQIRSAAYGE